MPSFDIESSYDKQEVTNAVDQTSREINTRYDFKNTHTSISFSNEQINIISSTEERLKAALQVLIEKLIKRKVSSKILSTYEETKESKGQIKRTYTLASGISQDNAKSLVKKVKEKDKKLQVSIQGPIVRVSGKKKDSLQEIMSYIKELGLNFPINFTNFKD